MTKWASKLHSEKNGKVGKTHCKNTINYYKKQLDRKSWQEKAEK